MTPRLADRHWLPWQLRHAPARRHEGHGSGYTSSQPPKSAHAIFHDQAKIEHHDASGIQRRRRTFDGLRSQCSFAAASIAATASTSCRNAAGVDAQLRSLGNSSRVSSSGADEPRIVAQVVPGTTARPAPPPDVVKKRHAIDVSIVKNQVAHVAAQLEQTHEVRMGDVGESAETRS